jgi:hypothetical protein
LADGHSVVSYKNIFAIPENAVHFRVIFIYRGAGTSTREGAYVLKSKPLLASPMSAKHGLVLVGFVLCGIMLCGINISPGSKKSLLICAYFCFDTSGVERDY